jgi:hypothetical protein
VFTYVEARDSLKFVEQYKSTHDIASLFIHRVCDRIWTVAETGIFVHYGTSDYRRAWALSKSGAIPAFD